MQDCLMFAPTCIWTWWGGLLSLLIRTNCDKHVAYTLPWLTVQAVQQAEDEVQKSEAELHDILQQDLAECSAQQQVRSTITTTFES